MQPYPIIILFVFIEGSSIVNLYPFFPISGCLIEISHGWLVMPVSKYLISTTIALLPSTSYKLDIWIKAALLQCFVELQKYNVILLMVEK